MVDVNQVSKSKSNRSPPISSYSTEKINLAQQIYIGSTSFILNPYYSLFLLSFEAGFALLSHAHIIIRR